MPLLKTLIQWYCLMKSAHPDVFNLLLQVMDNGTLTDNNGRKADFRNVIFVMTTNAGVTETVRKSIGLIQQDHSHDAMAEIKRVFTPEFRNRLDNIIWFNHLRKTLLAKSSINLLWSYKRS